MLCKGEKSWLFLHMPRVFGYIKHVFGGMFHYFERSDDRARAAQLINDLYGALYETELDAEPLSGLVGTHLQYLDTMSRSSYRDEYTPVQYAYTSSATIIDGWKER